MIRSRDDYDAMRQEMERLLDMDPSKGTPERERLDVLFVLLADYESRNVAAPVVDPVDAIRFRMDQLDLKPRDLEPYLGGRNRVSEVLSRKRPLSISMIRALHEGLGIPAESLIGSPAEERTESDTIAWDRFPIRELIARGWVEGPRRAKWTAEAARQLLEPLFPPPVRQMVKAALYRQSTHVRAAKGMDEHSLMAWTARVLTRDDAIEVQGRFQPEAFDHEAMKQLVRLSRNEDGPLRAREWLAKKGVALVVEPHLPRTRLDGAALRSPEGRPVIGLTLRYDRLDNFWFTLMHEVAHVVLHLAGAENEGSPSAFFDDLEVEGDDPRETEADLFAQECLVPTEEWRNSAVAYAPSVDAAIMLANKIDVSPAVVAGRVRHERRNFRLLGPLVGSGKVRKQFSEVSFD